MGKDLDVDPAALALVADGITETISDLSDLGVLAEGEVGRGFTSLTLTAMEAGHEGLASALAEFCDRWGWGVRGLVADANRAAVALDLSAGIYHDEDTYLKDSLLAAGKLLVASPYAPEDEG